MPSRRTPDTRRTAVTNSPVRRSSWFTRNGERVVDSPTSERLWALFGIDPLRQRALVPRRDAKVVPGSWFPDSGRTGMNRLLDPNPGVVPAPEGCDGARRL